MDRILRFTAVAALGLAFVVAAPAAKAQDGVTVGGWIEVIGGTTDNDKAGSVDGISRGLFSRIAVSYDNTLNNGLVISGRAAYQLNQRGSGVNVNTGNNMQSPRMDASTNYAPDVLYISIGGGFGTITVGAAAPASCSTLPRPIAFVNGVNGTHYTLFTGLKPTITTFSEFGYCGTPEQVSYTTPTINGFTAMLTWAPDNESNQGTTLMDAQDDDLQRAPPTTQQAAADEPGTPLETNKGDPLFEGQGGANIKDRIDLAASWSTSMGAANVSIGVGYQQGRYQVPRPTSHRLLAAGMATTTENELKSTTVAATVGLGALTLGASWLDTEEATKKYDGYTLAAKYDVGNLTLGTTWSTVEVEKGQEDTALVLGASYSVGGGLTAWLEYMDLEVDKPGEAGDVPETDDIILVGVTLGF